MDNNTIYAGSGHAKSAESGLMNSTAGLGIGAAAAGGAALSHGVGERAGVVLPRVRDDNSNNDKYIETGAEVTVLWPYVFFPLGGWVTNSRYTATLPDELDLRPGMKIRVLRLYDDAWGTGQVVSGGEEADVGKQGAFPIVSLILLA